MKEIREVLIGTNVGFERAVARCAQAGDLKGAQAGGAEWMSHIE